MSTIRGEDIAKTKPGIVYPFFFKLDHNLTHLTYFSFSDRTAAILPSWALGRRIQADLEVKS